MRTPLPPTMLFLALAAPCTLHAQAGLADLVTDGRSIGPGQEITGALTSEDEQLGDDSYGQAWALDANGLTVTVDLISAEFDAYLMLIGPGIDGRLVDDDGGGACNARITHTLELTGSYTIIVNTVRAGEMGAFTLRLSAEPPPLTPGSCGAGGNVPPGVQAALNAIPIEGVLGPGSEVQGELTDTTPTVTEDGPHALAWEIAGRAGAGVTIEMFSDAFDAFLVVTGPGLDEPLSDDDCGGGTDASLTFAFPSDTVYRVLATTFTPGETGPFSLFVTTAVDPANAPCRGSPDLDITAELDALHVEGTIAVGHETIGMLSADDETTADGSYAEAWEIDGTAGDSATIDLVSDAFDAFLVLMGPGIEGIMSDDDGAGACNSRITVTFPENATYRVIVSTIVAGAGGEYVLRVSADPGPVNPAACGG